MSEFKERMIAVIRSIPPGHVMSYGQVAAYMGIPRAARQVGWTLRSIESSVNLPWWRVLNNSGRISIDGNLYNDKHIQRKLLEAEGIIILDNYTLDINKYRFIPSDKALQQMQLDAEYI